MNFLLTRPWVAEIFFDLNLGEAYMLLMRDGVQMWLNIAVAVTLLLSVLIRLDRVIEDPNRVTRPAVVCIGIWIFMLFAGPALWGSASWDPSDRTMSEPNQWMMFLQGVTSVPVMILGMLIPNFIIKASMKAWKICWQWITGGPITNIATVTLLLDGNMPEVLKFFTYVENERIPKLQQEIKDLGSTIDVVSRTYSMCGGDEGRYNSTLQQLNTNLESAQRLLDDCTKFVEGIVRLVLTTQNCRAAEADVYYNMMERDCSTIKSRLYQADRSTSVVSLDDARMTKGD
jgi:hypothetical protein